jgi:hypothetical protein
MQSVVAFAALILAQTPPPEKEKPGKADFREFVKRGFYEGMPYTEAREQFGPDAVPILIKLLDDAEYAPHWAKVAQLVGYISRDSKSVPALLTYAARADDWRGLDGTAGYRRVLGKIEAVGWLGLVGSEEATKALRELVTVAGAAALVKKWGELPGAFAKDPGRAVALVRGRAAKGLVLARQAEDVAGLERAYRAEAAAVRAKGEATKWYSELVTALATRDLIAARALDGYLALQGTGKAHDAIAPFIQKYAGRPDEKAGSGLRLC